MRKNKVLVTCPPMLGAIDCFSDLFEKFNMEAVTPRIVQTLSEQELMDLVPGVDGWIIGDDPATKQVFEAGKAGKLKAAIKWGIGVDNVDISACKRLNIPFDNTPFMFGAEVADLAMSYVTALARHTFEIDRGVRQFEWPKPIGVSLAGKVVALIGYGDIGQNTAKRLLAANMKVYVYDPGYMGNKTDGLDFKVWPESLIEADFIVVNCALTPSSHHLLNQEIFESKVKKGVKLINVGRGPIIDQPALERALQNEVVDSAALDVFEREPLEMDSVIRLHPRCILGSHNASNTIDAVINASEVAITKLKEFLDRQQ
jgi:D-3-phosphoglycerate dehydrogenase